MTPASSIPATEARAVAAALVADLATSGPARLCVSGVDLGPGLEQVVFSALRAGTPPRRRPRFLPTALIRPLVAAASAARPTRSPAAAPALVTFLTAVHRRLFAPVHAELRQMDGDLRVAAVTAGRASRDPRLADLPSVERLATPRALLRLVGSLDLDRLRSTIAAATAANGLPPSFVPFIADTVVRLAVEAVRLDAAVATVRPRVVVTYDEIDAWGRLLAAVAHARGVAALDLPHAEAVDVEGIRGVAYDRIGVFGPRAADVVHAAGVDADRIRIVGPALFDAIVRRARREVDYPPRVVMAAQYRGGRMTDEIRQAVLQSAVAAAEAIEGRLELRPHPVEPGSAWDAALAEVRSSTRVQAEVKLTELHDLLPGAALLVTGWSNSVYEAVLSGVPAITVHVLGGAPPMPFAEGGIAAEARTPAEAALLATRLRGGSERRAALTRARVALEEHLGPLDGNAARRTAALVAEMARS